MKNIIYNIASLMTGVLLLSSCLKDKPNNLNPASGTNNVIEFASTANIAIAGSPMPLYVHSYDLGAEGELNVIISYSGAESAVPQDITVNLEILGQETIDIYNEAQKTQYELFPSTLYSLSSTVAVIKKGESKAKVQVKFKPDNFDFTKAYVLPLKIASVSSGIISGNFNIALYNIGAKNKYDGVYNYKTSANTSLVPNANKTVELVTAAADKVRLMPGLLATYSNLVEYTIDATTNQITVTCPSLGVQTPQDTRSKYDPATKTLTVFWKQGNGRRTFEEVFTYMGPRK